MESIEAVIEYFLKKKFGGYYSITRLIGTKETFKTAELEKNAAEIDEYERILRNTPTNELISSYKQLLAEDYQQARMRASQEEDARFYNQQSATADFVHWAKAAHWSIDEAIALSFGKEPDVVTWKKIEPLKDITKFAKAFAKRRDLAIRATRWKKFGDTLPPPLFIIWAKELHIELPNALIEEVTKIGGAALNWYEEYLKVKAELDALKKQGPENTQQTENLLQALACMAIDGYGYRPDDKKSVTHTEISNALKRHEKAIDRKTIKSWIVKGISLLPRKPL